MDPERWQRVERVLDRALSVEPDAWPALLEEACAGDAMLRLDAEALLAQVPRASRFLASPPSVVASALIADATRSERSIADVAGQE
jgi:hypothetical protein